RCGTGCCNSRVRLLLDTEAFQMRVDVFPAAVHDDDWLAAFPRLRDPAQHLRAPRGVLEKASSQLDHSHANPSVSGYPHMRLKFCTACDAAPLRRLSMTETITARRPPCSSV